MTDDSPLILTMMMDDESSAFFNNLRQQHFPKERNYLQAHLTLFHHLPGSEIDSIQETLLKLSQWQDKMKLMVTEIRHIGRGVAYKMESSELIELHKKLQQQWHGWLTPQDQQKLWPHVTVQNKVPPEQAKQLQQDLTRHFNPFTVMGVGLQLWEYQGGPWQLLQEFHFNG